MFHVRRRALRARRCGQARETALRKDGMYDAATGAFCICCVGKQAALENSHPNEGAEEAMFDHKLQDVRGCGVSV